MTGSLTERYDDRIAGVLSCYDRVVVTGTLPTVCYAAGMTKFLYAIGVRIFDYPQFASTLRDRVRERAASLAAQAGITIEHIAKSHIRKEAVVAEDSALPRPWWRRHRPATRPPCRPDPCNTSKRWAVIDRPERLDSRIKEKQGKLPEADRHCRPCRPTRKGKGEVPECRAAHPRQPISRLQGGPPVRIRLPPAESPSLAKTRPL